MKNGKIEQPPFKFEVSQFDFASNIQYILEYKATDEKGRYLYWDELKYRIKKGDDPHIAWWATKFNRIGKIKSLPLKDIENKHFAYSIPDSLEAKLFNIAQYHIAPQNGIKNDYLISSLILEEAISSSQLEGAATTRKVAKDMLLNEKKAKNEDEWMIINNYLLLKEVKKRKDEKLSLYLIREFHKIATSHTIHNNVKPGLFRDNDEIYIGDYDNNILFTPPLSSEIEERLEALVSFANKNHNSSSGDMFINPIVKGIILHFMIGFIHPFNDGNGRVARALFYWYMLKSGFEYFEYVSISGLLKNAPVQYAKSYLYSENDDNDLTYFIAYQIDIIARAIEKLNEYMENKSKEISDTIGLLKRSKYHNLLNLVQNYILQDAIKESGKIFTTREISNKYNISENSARKYLNQLSEYKLLQTSKMGRNTIYISTNDIKERLAIK